MSLRILVVDDYETVRKGVCAILSARLDVEICGEAANGRQAIEQARKLKPDFIILDATMPMLNGFDAAREILKILPGVPILMLPMHDHRQFLEEAKRVGVKGYVTKTQVGVTLLHAIDALLNGQTFFSGID